MRPLQLLYAVTIALTAADGQLSRDVAFSTRIYITPPKALPDEPLKLDCESFLDLISDNYFEPAIKYQGAKRLRLVRGQLSGLETVVAEMRDTDRRPRLLDALFKDADVWGFFHLKRVQQINVTVPKVRCEHTGPYWCQSDVMVNGRLLAYRSKPREFLIPLAVYPTLTLSPDLVSLEDLNASLTLKCSLDPGRKNRLRGVILYAITFYGSVMAVMDKAGRIFVSDSYKSRNLTAKGRPKIFPPYLQVTLPAIDCSDLGAYRCSVQTTDYFGSMVTVHALENLRHSDGSDAGEDLCPLEVRKSSNHLQAGLPFSLTCSTAVGRLAALQYSQARIPEVKMFRKSGTEVTVAEVTKTGARGMKPGERARGIVSSTRVLSLQYEVDKAGCEHFGVYWCTARVNTRLVKGPSNFFGFPCKNCVGLQLVHYDCPKSEHPPSNKSEQPPSNKTGPTRPEKGEQPPSNKTGPTRPEKGEQLPSNKSEQLPSNKSEQLPSNKTGPTRPEKGDEPPLKKPGPKQAEKDVLPNMRLAVDMVRQARLQNAISVSCLLPSKDVTQLRMAKITLNNQEVLSARHDMELKTRGQYGFHDGVRTEAMVRYKPTSTWVGVKMATRPFFCSLAGHYTCTLTFTTLANKTTTLTSTAMNLPPLIKLVETRVYAESENTLIVNCSGIFETPGSTFQPQYRYTETDPWRPAATVPKLQSERSTADTCWPQGNDVFNGTSLAKPGMDWQCILLSPGPL